MSSLLDFYSSVGLPVCSPIAQNGIPLQDRFNWQPFSFDIPTSPSSTPSSTPSPVLSQATAAAAAESTDTPRPPKRKRQLTEEEVKQKLLTGLDQSSSSQETPAATTTTYRNDIELFDRSVELGQVCQNIMMLELQQNMGLIDQVFCIGGIVVEVLQHKLNSRNCSKISEELQKFSVSLGKTKVAEAKRLYELCRKFPKLRRVRSGFSPMELTQGMRHFDKICSADREFWSQE